MKSFKFIIKRYKYFFIGVVICVLIYYFNQSLGDDIFQSTKSSILQMLSVLPPVMLLLSLMDVWIPRESFMKYMGDSSGIVGIVLAFLIAFFAAGPMYAAFPFTAILLKKGVKFSNIMIFLNAWCVTKASTLLFEISSLGLKFTLVRLVIDIPGVILLGYITDYFANKKYLNKKKLS